MEGVAEAEAIDTIAKLGFAHPMGPLALADLIGLDTCVAIMEVLHDGLGDPKYAPCPLLRYVAAGRLGRKSGRGFYEYAECMAARVDAARARTSKLEDDDSSSTRVPRGAADGRPSREADASAPSPSSADGTLSRATFVHELVDAAEATRVAAATTLVALGLGAERVGSGSRGCRRRPAPTSASSRSRGCSRASSPRARVLEVGYAFAEPAYLGRSCAPASTSSRRRPRRPRDRAGMERVLARTSRAARRSRTVRRPGAPRARRSSTSAPTTRATGSRPRRRAARASTRLRELGRVRRRARPAARRPSRSASRATTAGSACDDARRLDAPLPAPQASSSRSRRRTSSASEGWRAAPRLPAVRRRGTETAGRPPPPSCCTELSAGPSPAPRRPGRASQPDAQAPRAAAPATAP